IVPTDEIDATMGCVQLAADEYLVKYFEDCKYSTVRGSELCAFDTGQRPFTDFAVGSPAFVKDKAIRAALSFLKTGHVHAKFQWRKWQTGADSLQLPFDLPPPTGRSASPPTADVATPANASDSESTADSEDIPLTADSEDIPLAAACVAMLATASESTATPAAGDGSPPNSDKAALLAAVDGGGGSPQSSKSGPPTPEPQDDASHEAAVPSGSTTPPPSHARARRTRHQKQLSTNSTPRRGRQPGRQQHQSRRQLSPSPATSRQPRQQRQASESTSASDDKSLADTTAAIVSVIKELGDVQEEFRVYHTLVREAAKDLWLEMGNEWPPNPGTSTRYGKRRKVA
ncbi:hypothetical protein LPJ61_006048, partial [Coemansia biformis]